MFSYFYFRMESIARWPYYLNEKRTETTQQWFVQYLNCIIGSNQRIFGFKILEFA
jgi:hypothetical protein